MSTKDLLYIEDIFNWNLTIYQTVLTCEQNIDDENLLKELAKIKKVHMDNMKMIKGVLENG